MIAITGATGQTGSKIANLLLEKGKMIRVISRTENNVLPLHIRGAEMAIGDQADVAFLTKAFSGCRVVYLLIPPKMDTQDFRSYYNTMGDVAVEAIRASGVKKVVFLSSLGAELEAGTGPVVGLHDVEAKLEKLTQVDMVILRPGYFMENTLRNASLIKKQRINGNTNSPDIPVTMIATRDIAKKAAELLETSSFTGHTVVELFGDRISYKEATRLIGEAIGFPALPYVRFDEEDAVNSMMSMGVSENMARSFIKLSRAIEKGEIHPLYIDPLKPNTSTSYKDFVNEVFKPVYHKAV
jgi:uncharacterized protein YbjT (DUF2867 family)